jgi:hypothetical protein
MRTRIGAGFLTTLLLFAIGIGGCQSNASVTEEINMEIMPIKELQSHREAAAQGNGSIDWIMSSAAGQEWKDADTPQARETVQAALRSAAPTLASVDYASLSLPDFVTVTKALKLQLADFEQGDVRADYFGQSASGGERWILYEWRGPEILKHPNRPIVFRWVQVYVLYNITQNQVTRLLPTIRGEVHE